MAPRSAVIYLDTSAALAELYGERRQPSPTLWDQDLISSRLLDVELWCSVRRQRLVESHGRYAAILVSRVNLIDLSPEVLARACQAMPIQLRTLDAIHLATLLHALDQEHCALATYDKEMRRAGATLELDLADAHL